MDSSCATPSSTKTSNWALISAPREPTLGQRPKTSPSMRNGREKIDRIDLIKRKLLKHQTVFLPNTGDICKNQKSTRAIAGSTHCTLKFFCRSSKLKRIQPIELFGSSWTNQCIINTFQRTTSQFCARTYVSHLWFSLSWLIIECIGCLPQLIENILS